MNTSPQSTIFWVIFDEKNRRTVVFFVKKKRYTSEKLRAGHSQIPMLSKQTSFLKAHHFLEGPSHPFFHVFFSEFDCLGSRTEAFLDFFRLVIFFQ